MTRSARPDTYGQLGDVDGPGVFFRRSNEGAIGPVLVRATDARPSGSDRIARQGAAAAWLFTATFLVLNATYVALAVTGPPQWEGLGHYVATWSWIEFAPQAVGIVALPVLGFVLAAVHLAAPPERRASSLSALLFGTAFIVVVWSGYVLQLVWLLPALAAGSDSALVETMVFRNPDGLAWALNYAGWGLSGLTGIALSGVFRGGRLESRLRWLFLAYGVANLLLLPQLALRLDLLALPAIASWLLVLPVATGHLAVWFGRGRS